MNNITGKIKQPEKGYHSGYVGVFSAGELYKNSLLELNTENEEIHEFDDIYETIERMTEVSVGIKLLYYDTDVFHIDLECSKLQDAISTGKNVSKLLNNEIGNLLGWDNFPPVELEMILNGIYYVGKKRYITTISWFKNNIMYQPTFRIVGMTKNTQEFIEYLGKEYKSINENIPKFLSQMNK